MALLSEDVRVKTLADWNAVVNDQNSLKRDPHAHIKTLTHLAYVAYRNKQITDDDLCDMLELIDAAHEWASEEQLNRKPLFLVR